jgi:hypothetical protein
MPDQARIRVTVGHIESLRHQGPQACMTWNEDTGRVEAVSPDRALRPNRMIITGHRGLGELAELRTTLGDEATDEVLAEDLTCIANDWLAEWPEVRAMNLQVEEVRGHLADKGVHLVASPTFTLPATGLPQLTDYYRLADGELTASVTVTFGFMMPTRIVTEDERGRTRREWNVTLVTNRAFSHAVTSKTIAATVTRTLAANH